VIDSLYKEIDELRQSDKDPIDFAIEAIRLNIVVACFKHEVILYEAMNKLKEYKARGL